MQWGQHIKCFGQWQVHYRAWPNCQGPFAFTQNNSFFFWGAVPILESSRVVWGWGCDSLTNPRVSVIGPRGEPLTWIRMLPWEALNGRGENACSFLVLELWGSAINQAIWRHQDNEDWEKQKQKDLRIQSLHWAVLLPEVFLPFWHCPSVLPRSPPFWFKLIWVGFLSLSIRRILSDTRKS